MAFDEVRLGFIDYLLEKNIITKDQAMVDMYGDASIFVHFEDFKNFLIDKHLADTSIFNKTISEIRNMDYIDGKLVAKQEQGEVFEKNTETDIENENGNETETENTIALLNDILQDESMVKGLDTDQSGDLDIGEISTFFAPENEQETDTTEKSSETDKMLENIYSDGQVLKYLDEDGDGKLSEEEKAKFEAFVKGGSEELTPEALQKAYDSMKDGTFDEEGFKNFGLETQTKEKAEETKDTPTTEETKQTEQPKQTEGSNHTSGGSSSGGNYNPGVESGRGTGKTKAETIAEIERAISDKTAEISNAETEAEQKIKEQEDAKAKAMEEAGVSEEEYQAYKEKEQEIEENISEKDKEIKDKDSEISDKESSVSSNKNYISSIEAKIAENNEKRLSADEEDAAEKNADLDAKNQALENEKAKIEEENRQLEEDIEKAKSEKEQLETDKKELEAQKSELLNTTLDNSESFGKGMTAAEKADLKEQISQYDKNISEIRANKDQKVSALNEEIKALQVQLKDVKALDERNKVLDENTFSIGLGLTGEQLVQKAWDMLNTYGATSGYCATGVSRTFKMAYGLSLSGNGCDWYKNMENLVSQGAFKEVTNNYATSADLANLPAGAVVCWDKTTGTGGGGAQYGHVCIADGKGGEISDHYSANILRSVGGRSDTYRVFIPT